MSKFLYILLCFGLFTAPISAVAQSGRVAGYSESPSASSKFPEMKEKAAKKQEPSNPEDEIVRVETDLITVPVRIRTKRGKPVSNLLQSEFKIFENGVEQEIAYFSDEEQPFTVALMLDMSYSSVFKLEEIHAAALAFIEQLRESDRVMVISFDEKTRILCEATNDRKALRLAIEGAKIGSGTSVYAAFDLVLKEKLRSISGRKAIVLLSDGVDTSSESATAKDIEMQLSSADVLVYPVRYNTFDDVQKSRRNTAPIQYDDNDRPYTLETQRVKGEREVDYAEAKEFLSAVADETGGRVYSVNSTTNLRQAFANIANELRKIYSLGYYPSEERQGGGRYEIKVRVYRAELLIDTRRSYSIRPAQ
ncbi:MAG: VWA domain-containing protein [Blastocatellia bacterium]